VLSHGQHGGALQGFEWVGFFKSIAGGDTINSAFLILHSEFKSLLSLYPVSEGFFLFDWSK